MMVIPGPHWAMPSFQAFISLPVQQHGQHPSWRLDSSFSPAILDDLGGSGGVGLGASLSCSSMCCHRRVCTLCRRYGLDATDSLVYGVACEGRRRSATLRRVYAAASNTAVRVI